LRSLVLIVFIAMNGAFLANASSDIEETTSKQIAWAAANIDNPQVVVQFKNSFQELLATKNSFANLKTPEGQKVLQQGKNLLGVIELRDQLEKCLVEQSDALGIRNAIASALGQQALTSLACMELTNRAPKIFKFGQELNAHLQESARNDILKAAHLQLQQTQSYWQDIEKQAPANLALDLTERELDIKITPPQAGAELLLYTKSLRERKNKTYIAESDVKNAFSEIQNELKQNKNYLSEMSSTDPEKALRRLIATNPAAVAQYLMEHPESIDLICHSLQSIDQKINREEKLDKAFLWGGLVIAGVLIASGVGAFAGGALAATLTTIAAGAAIAGTATSVGDTIYSSSKAHEAYIAAQNIRSSAFSEGLNAKNLARVDDAEKKSQSEFISAGFSAASIIPFGTGFKVMKSFSNTRAVTTVLKEVSDDKVILKVLEKTKSQIPEDEMGQFLGSLSLMSPSEKSQVYALMKSKPEKLTDAIREANKNGVCK
jgi:hypothetical protein